MSTTTDPRQVAAAKIAELMATLKSHQGPATAPILEECEALARAVASFHLEGIRFRVFNVDRLLTRGDASVPESARALLEQIRIQLEAAGFHTRSHGEPVKTT